MSYYRIVVKKGSKFLLSRVNDSGKLYDCEVLDVVIFSSIVEERILVKYQIGKNQEFMDYDLFLYMLHACIVRDVN